MKPEDPRLLRLAGSILEETGLDWDEIERSAPDEEERNLIRRLRVVRKIADVHRHDHLPRRATAPDELPTESVRPPDAVASTIPTTSTFIGNFRIVRKLGEGGMAVVYEAEQQHPRRAVALKIIRGGSFVDDDRVKMFRREAQTLARLKHPNIAAIYESGCTSDGQHFFAMELVRGETLTNYLKRKIGDRGPPAGELDERLILFRKLCEAVNYAHQRGVIHRDLKPSNVVVLRDGVSDGSGSTAQLAPDLKVLDFGLARITDIDVTMSTVVTEVGRVQGTLSYMSPEQARGNPDEIDLRSDVYSLGVILYELLTGHLPYDLRRAGLPEVVRIICEEPPRPLSRIQEGMWRLDADVQTIVYKALEKEPARRYQTAAALVEDIQRYQTDQPILAHPPSTAYQFRKLVSRHKAPFAFVAALFLLLAGFAVTMTIQARRIAREAETARQISAFLVRLFEVSDPTEARGNTITAREILDQGAQKIEHELAAQPLVQAGLMHTIGKVYMGLALYQQAAPLLEKAVEIRRRELGEDHADYARSLLELGEIYTWHTSRLEEGKALVERALGILERKFGSEHPEVGWGLYYFKSVLVAKGQMGEAQRALERALAIFEKDPKANYIGVSWCVNDLGMLRAERQDWAGARPYFERALAIKERELPPDHPDVALALNNLGYALSMVGDYASARPMLERSVALREKIYGLDHDAVADGLHSLGEMWRLAGDPTKARPLFERAVAIRENLDPNPANQGALAYMLHGLAATLRGAGQFEEAEPFFKRALAIRETGALLNGFGSEPLQLAETLTEYAKLLRQTNREAEAEKLEARASAIVKSRTTESLER